MTATWVRNFEFKPLRAQPVPHSDTVVQHLSPRARRVFDAIETAPDAVDSTMLSTSRWAAWKRGLLLSCEPGEQLDVLAAYSVIAHELTHQLDTYLSPYGGVYAARFALETSGFLAHCPADVDELERREPHSSLLSVLRRSSRYRTRDGLPAFTTRAHWLAAMSGGAHARVTEGWGVGVGPTARLFGSTVHLVTVNDTLRSFRTPHTGYLTVHSIVEARAISVSALNLLAKLGEDAVAEALVIRLLATIYNPAERFAAYRAVFSLLPHGEDLFNTNADRSGRSVASTLRLVASLTWYALQVDGHAREGAELPADPVVRFLIATKAFEQEQRSHTSSTAGPAAVYARADTILRPAGQVASRTERALEYVHAARLRNELELGGTPLGSHLDRLLGIHEQGLTARVQDPRWETDGDLLDGNLETAISNLPTSLQDALFTEAETPEQLDRYMRVRENILLRTARPIGVWNDYWSLVHDLNPQGDATEARALAVETSRVWREVHETSAQIDRRTITDAESTVLSSWPCAVIPRAWFADRFDGSAPDDLVTTWIAWRVGALPGFALRIDAPEMPVPVHVSFAYPDDFEAITATLADPFIVMIAEESLTRSPNGTWTAMERFGLSFTADPAPVIRMLNSIGVGLEGVPASQDR